MNVETLNQTNKEWLNLSPDAPEKEKQRVYSLMEKQPKKYISGSHKNGWGIISRGMPLTGSRMELAQVIDLAKSHGIQTKFAWSCPNWIELTY
tara:strand:- start:379 stop:657 length:279 start_codon:yes stop_codon:yes gene_type:complete